MARDVVAKSLYIYTHKYVLSCNLRRQSTTKDGNPPATDGGVNGTFPAFAHSRTRGTNFLAWLKAEHHAHRTRSRTRDFVSRSVP